MARCAGRPTVTTRDETGCVIRRMLKTLTFAPPAGVLVRNMFTERRRTAPALEHAVKWGPGQTIAFETFSDVAAKLPRFIGEVTLFAT